MTTQDSPDLRDGEIVADRPISFHVNEDGTACEAPICLIYRQTEKLFLIELPKYMHAPLACNEIEAERAADLLQMYADHCEQYQRWKLASKARSVIVMDSFTTDTYGVGFRAYPAVQINELFFDLQGSRIHPIPGFSVLDDSPELRERLADFSNSIRVAKSYLINALGSNEPEAALLRIPVLTEVEVDDVIERREKTAALKPTVEPATAAAPAPDDDDEL